MSVDDGLRGLFRKHLPGPCHWQTIERLLDRGVPDSNVCLEGRECWIEYKAASQSFVKFRPEQIGWHLTRLRHGGRSFAAVRRRTKRSDRWDELWLFWGAAAPRLAAEGLEAYGCDPGGPLERPLGRSGDLLGAWAGGPARWPWGVVRGLLRDR